MQSAIQMFVARSASRNPLPTPSGQRPEIYQPRASRLGATSEARCTEESVALGNVCVKCSGLKARNIVPPPSPPL